MRKQENKNAPAKNAPQQSPYLGEKRQSIIQPNNSIQSSYQIMIFDTYAINIPSNIYTDIW